MYLSNQQQLLLFLYLHMKQKNILTFPFDAAGRNHQIKKGDKNEI